jgi:tRNA wybutosine-synthesizing protein 4
MSSKKGAKVEFKQIKNKSKKELIDDSIQGTNDSSIVSKRSVERLYWHKHTNLLGKPLEFFKHFVAKPQRRSPVINRGYWTRMEAMRSVIDKFAHSALSVKTKVVVNLGCGL